MRTKAFLLFSSMTWLALAGGCNLVLDIDRSKIPTDAGADAADAADATDDAADAADDAADADADVDADDASVDGGS